MDLLDVSKEEAEDVPREFTRSALGPLVGESSSDDLDDMTPSRSSGVVEDNPEPDDDVDDEITAVFNENDPEDSMSKSWQCSRSSSQRSLAFFVDMSASGPTPAPGINRSMSYSQDQRRVASARSRTRAGSCSTSFFVDMSDNKVGRVRSISRLENSDQLNELSNDISNKSKELMAKNVQESQKFFTKLKAFIDFLNKPNYSKDEVRHKKVLADKITRVMFEEEQRLRRGMDLSEIKNLESILNTEKIRPNSAYAAMQHVKQAQETRHNDAQKLKEPTQSLDVPNPEVKPVLRREKTFDLEQGSVLTKELKLLKKKNRNSMPVTLDIPIIDDVDGNNKKTVLKETVTNGWMMEDISEKENGDSLNDCEEVNVLKYFQQQRLEYTRQLRKEIQRLEKLENVYLAALKKSNASTSLKSKVENSRSSTATTKELHNNEPRKHKKLQSQRSREGLERKLTFTRPDYSRNQNNSRLEKTNFKEVADRRKCNEGCQQGSIIMSSSTPASWTIPSDPPSRCQSNNKMTYSRQNSNECSSPPPPPTTRYHPPPSHQNHHSFGWNNHTKSQRRQHFSHQYPSRQSSQDTELPSQQCRGIQTGNSLLRQYLKRDKGQQVCDRPQAFFLPLDQSSNGDNNVIDLEITDDKEDVANLQEALRKNRPDYIAAAAERAGRLSRNSDERKQKEDMVTKPTRIPKSNSTSKIMSKSYPNPRVNSILKSNNGVTNGIKQSQQLKQRNVPKTEKNDKKSVTIAPPPGDQQRKPGVTRNNVAVLKSRPNNNQHYNLKNIYAPDTNVKALKNKVY